MREDSEIGESFREVVKWGIVQEARKGSEGIEHRRIKRRRAIRGLPVLKC